MNDFEHSPIRILDKEIIDFFSRANKETVAFHNELNTSINHEILFCSDKFSTPSVNLSNKTICLSMPFLDSLWCFFFAMHILHEEIIKFSQQNPEAQNFNIQSVEVGKHYTFVINQFNSILNNKGELDWNNEFVSTKNFSFSKQINDYIIETNQLYIIGVSAIILHECSHIYYKHSTINKSDKEIKLEEREADKKANSLLLESVDISENSDKEYTIAYAIILDYLAMLFICKSNTKIIDKTHPTIQDRIRFLFEDFIENSTIDENTKISLYHLCLQVFDMFLSQRNSSLLNYDNITDVRKAFYENLDVMDKFVKSDN